MHPTIGTRATSAARLALALLGALWTSPASAQLDESCSVSVLGRTVDVHPSGGFHVSGLPVGPELVRASAVCAREGRTLYGRSELFEVRQHTIYYVQKDIALSETPPVSVLSLAVAADEPVLTNPFATTQVRVTARLSDDSTADLTARAMGTTYRSSNPAVASVDLNGLVRATGRGSVAISVTNEGVVASTLVHVSPGDPLTTVEGLVVGTGGAPASGALVTTFGLGGLALTGSDGKFSLAGIPSGFGQPVLVFARIGSVSPPLFGRALGPPPVPAGFTDAGTIVLRPLCALERTELGDAALVLAMKGFDDGRGPALYAGGAFDTAGPPGTSRIARWDGKAFSALGSGVNGTVQALAVFDDGRGSALFAAGEFTTAGGLPASFVARWNGTSWAALGAGTDRMVRALAVYDDGRGPALYAAGDFSAAGGAAASHVARWDGTSWSALGSGLDGPPLALAVFDDGRGPALYAAGGFTSAGGGPAASIARWDGLTWSALGAGVAGLPAALAVHDDGRGEALYVGGDFASAGGATASHVARWDGTSWSQLGSGLNAPAASLAVFDDGTVPSLIAGGSFTAAGGSSAAGAARWDGSSWAALEPGFDNHILALAAFDEAQGSALYGSQIFNLVRWHRPESCAR
jgi:hypothetical protein